MNILFVCPSLSNGGAERVCVCWANGLSALGHKVDILIRPDAKISYFPDKSVDVLTLPKVTNSILKHIPLLRETLALKKLIIDKGYDVVVEVLFYLYFPLRFATWLCKPKIPTIFTSHEAMERPKNVKHKFKVKFINFFANRLFDHITVLTNRDAEILKSKGFTNVTVLHNPLFLEPKAIDSRNKEKIVLSVGRIDQWFCKGFDLLIEAWNIIYPRFQDWKLQIIGASSETALNYLNSMVKHKGSIVFIPFTESIPERYSKASVYCLSSRYEGWGLVIPEAMSRSCAVIACDFNGRQAEIIQDRVSGLLCEPQNVNDLVAKLEEVMSDENLRKTLQQNAVCSLGDLHVSNIAKELEETLSRVCNSSNIMHH